MVKSIFKTIVKSFGLIFLTLLLGFFGVFAVVGASSAAYLVSVNSSLPTYEELENRDVPESSKLYSRDGTLLYEFHGEYKRTQIPLDKISQQLINATIAIEDRDFYNHGAISVQSIGRALVANYNSGDKVQGGSTITQQFVKNALLTRKKSYARKLREVLLAYKIESHFEKDEILELYFNEIPYGRNAYGAEAAAQVYFGKGAAELNLAESAYLAALPQAPSYYSPTGANTQALVDRKNLVLQVMYDQGYISEQELYQAQSMQVAFLESRTKIIAPYFVSWVQNYLIEKYGVQFLKEGGLKVYSSLDLKLQEIAERVVKEGAESNTIKNRASNAALVAVDPITNKVLAMVGGKDYFGTPEPVGCKVGANCRFEPNVNVADRLRQPGSSFKPYAYLTAFKPEFGYTPLSKVLDAPTVFGTSGGKPYAPQNYDGSYHGLITMRSALAGSLNIPAVKTLQAVGVDNVINTARSLGINSPLKNCGLSLVLGGCEVTLVDHVTAFSVLANGGKTTTGSAFFRIEDKHGQVLEESSRDAQQVVNPEAVYELISIMTDNHARTYVFGDKSPLILPDGRPVAAKTGTTQGWKDGWTLGFTPQLAVGVWTGNNDGTLMRAGADGVFTAAPIWQKFMIEALKDIPSMEFEVPAGIIQVAYDRYSNRPVSRDTKNVRMEPIPWYALPKDIQVSAAPKNLQKSLIGPIDGTIVGEPKHINSTTQRTDESLSVLSPPEVLLPGPPPFVDYGGSNEAVQLPEEINGVITSRPDTF